MDGCGFEGITDQPLLCRVVRQEVGEVLEGFCLKVTAPSWES